MITIIETRQFIKKVESLMDSDERQALVVYIAQNPQAGDIIPRTGGVRKLRVAGKGRGKSGGYRVIYYYYDDKNPVLLFTIYGKNEKANLTDAEEKALYDVVQAIKKEMKS